MYSVDRIENGTAVIIDDNSVRREIPVSSINGSVKEGDMLIFKDGEYFPDKQAAEKKRREIKKLQDSLWE